MITKWLLSRQGIMVMVLLTIPVFLVVFYLSGVMAIGTLIGLTVATLAFVGINVYDKLKDTKKDATDLIEKAQFMLKRGEYKGAAEVFRRALKVDDASFDSYIGLAIACKSMLDFREAEEAFKMALALKPGSPEGHYSLGTLYYNQGKHADAVRELEEAIELDMKLHEAYYFMGDSYVQLGNREKARDYLRRYTNLCPSSPNIGRVKGWLETLEEG